MNVDLVHVQVELNAGIIIVRSNEPETISVETTIRSYAAWAGRF